MYDSNERDRLYEISKFEVNPISTEILVRCPNCDYIFDSQVVFAWEMDDHGDPTMEYISCPRCLISTHPMINCNICPSRFKCNLEECGATISANYDDFKEVQSRNEEKK